MECMMLILIVHFLTEIFIFNLFLVPGNILHNRNSIIMSSNESTFDNHLHNHHHHHHHAQHQHHQQQSEFAVNYTFGEQTPLAAGNHHLSSHSLQHESPYEVLHASATGHEHNHHNHQSTAAEGIHSSLPGGHLYTSPNSRMQQHHPLQQQHHSHHSMSAGSIESHLHNGNSQGALVSDGLNGLNRVTGPYTSVIVEPQQTYHHQMAHEYVHWPGLDCGGADSGGTEESVLARWGGGLMKEEE